MLLSSAPSQLVNPHPLTGDQFGLTVAVLANGNVLITSPNDTAGGNHAGAIYLYDGQTGSLLSSITGSHDNDQIGSGGVSVLANGNFVIDSPTWNGNEGAVTFGNATTGVAGIVSAANSLVGSTAGDYVGGASPNAALTPQGITVLTNGNYVVDSPSWNNNRGAVTFCSGTTGLKGVVSASNSLVGSTGGTSGDFVGDSGVTALSNGSYVVNSQNWNTASVTSTGAVTWSNGTTGVKGIISAANSLTGIRRGTSQAGASFTQAVTALTNGNYVVDSPYWNNSMGAVTWGSGTTGVVGTTSAANSLVGSTFGDFVGLYYALRTSTSGVTALSNGNYVVDSYLWHDGTGTDTGAVTWGSGTSGVTGTISAANSLVGTGYDQVGAGHVTALSNGHYVVDSPSWNSDSGAVTLCDGTTGTTGTISAANSLVGGTGSADEVGYGGITELSNGNYVVDSPVWNFKIGAVTWVNGNTGLTGLVSTANSFVGSDLCNTVGSVSITALTNGNYVIDSAANYLVGANNDVPGAVTLANGITGLTGAISATNSLVGNWVGNGGVAALSNGNYVVDSYWWNNGSVRQAGAVTFGNGTTGVTGTVSSANSLVGTQTSDLVGAGGVIALANGNYVASSLEWNRDSATGRGAVSWGNGTTGVAGVVSAANSLVGTAEYNSGGVTVLSDGNYVVNYSSNINLFGTGATGLTGNAQDINGFSGQFIFDPAHSAVYLTDYSGGDIGSGVVYCGNSVIGLLSIFNITIASPSIAVSDYASPLNNLTSPSLNVPGSRSSEGVALNFGTTTLGTPVAQTITVSNNGMNPLIVQPVTAPAGFSILDNFTANESIASGTSASFTVQLNASATGSATGTVSIHSSSATNGTFAFNITGTVAVPKIVVQQGSTLLSNGTGTVALPGTLIGTPVTKVITVTNSGNSTLVVSTVTVPAGFSVVNDSTTIASIAPHSSASFTLQLNATTSGTPNGVVTIVDNDPTASPFTFHVIGTVTAPKIAVQQGSTTLASGIGVVDLGSIPLGTPVTRVFAVTNGGNAPLIVQPVIVPAGFSIVAGTNFTANQSIPAGASASFTLRLDAGSVGVSTGLITITNSDTTSRSFTLNVTGIVKPTTTSVPLLHVMQGAMTLANSAGPIMFNSAPAGTVVTQTFSVTNNGNAPLVVQPVTVPSGFSLLNNFTANQSIPAGATVSFQIQLNANAPGSPTGTAMLSTNDPIAQSFAFTVAANYPPSDIKLGNSSGVITSSQTTAGFVGVLTTVDPDSSSLRQTYAYSATAVSLNGASTNSPFSIDSNGDLTLMPGAAIGVYSVSINSTDQQGLSLVPPKNFTIYVTGASTTPIGSSQTAASGTPGSFLLDTFPTTISTTHDAPGDPNVNVNLSTLKHVINHVTYSLASGGDNANFTIDASGHLQTAGALNASVKSTYQISIITTDTVTGVSTIHPYTIKVSLVVNHTIVVPNATFAVAEASVNGTVVGNISATDNGGLTPTYAITDDNTGGAFAINSTTGQITVANSAVLTLATNPMFSLTVQVTDAGVSASATITINLATMVLSNSSIAENAAIGTTIGQFTTTEAGSGNTFTYSLAPGTNDNANFTIDASGHLKLNSALNAAVKNSYTIDVASTDQHGVSLSEPFTITVLGPSNITLSNSSVARTAPIGSVIGQFKTTDAGTGNTFHYSLVPHSANDALFTIDADGNLKLNLHLTSTLRKSLTVNVVSTDQRGLKITKIFTITVSWPRVL